MKYQNLRNRFRAYRRPATGPDGNPVPSWRKLIREAFGDPPDLDAWHRTAMEALDERRAIMADPVRKEEYMVRLRADAAKQRAVMFAETKTSALIKE